MIKWFIWPFTWWHVFVPALPDRLREIVEAPVPVMLGIVGDGYELNGGVEKVNLDRGIIEGTERRKEFAEIRSEMELTIE